MNFINYDDLSYDILIEKNNSTLKIIKEGIDFYIKINLKPETNYLIAFSNGAINPEKKQPPVFMRSKWHKDYDASCVFIDDRTIHDTDMTIGWGIGTKDRYYIHDYYEIIRRICEILDCKSNNVIYYGSSAGGFMSIALASYHRGSYAVANNPQTYVYKYQSNHVNKIYKNIFGGMSKQYILKKYSTRFSLGALMSKNKNIPKTFYLQNRLCDNDMEKHLNPFLANAKKYNIDLTNINFLLYDDKFKDHNPIGREKSVKFINNLIDTDFSTFI